MPNIGELISKHNKRKTRQINQPLTREACKAEGRCGVESVVYCASVTETISGKTETYTGLTQGTLRSRIQMHEYDFRTPAHKSSTSLSSHIWSLKDQNLNFDVKWKVLTRAQAYQPASKICHLCNAEVYYILFKPETASLNKRSELKNKCRHVNKFKMRRN